MTRRPCGTPRPWASAALGGLTVALCLAGCGGLGARPLSDCREDAGGREAERGRLMPLCVDTVRGAMRIEEEYLPGVLECEVGGFRKTPAALEAQAIVARTYLLAHLTRRGPDAVVRLDARFQCWKPPKSDAVGRAVEATRDVVLHRDGDVLDGNFASGTPKRGDDCRPQPPTATGYAYETWEAMRAAYVEARRAGRRLRFDGIAWTELLIPDNAGRTGLAVEPTPFAPVRPTNRGAFGQWAAACLAAKQGLSAPDIVRAFFGSDVQFSRPPTSPEAPPRLDSPGAG